MRNKNKVNETPTNLKKSLNNLLKYIGVYKKYILIALVLAALSSILSIIGPNKLSDLTDEISSGLVINEKEVKKITELIVENKDNNFKTLTYKKIKIDTDDQIEYLKILNSLNEVKDVNDIYDKLDEVPESIYNIIKPKMNFEQIKIITSIMLILYISSAIFNFIQSFIMADVTNNFSNSLRKKISKKINKLPLSYFDNNSIGDLLSRVTNDIDMIGISLYQSLGSLVGAITLFIGTTIMMFVTNYIMAITAILSSLIGFIFMFIVLSKSQKYFNQKQIEIGALDGHIEEIYTNHNIVKVYNGEYDALEKFEKYNNRVYECNKMSQFLSGLMPPIMNFIGNLGYVLVCVVGSLLVMNNNITFGVIVAFMIYIRLFTNPLSQIAQGMGTMQSVLAASERVFALLEANEMTKEDNKVKLSIKKVKGNIEFKNVKFGYNEDKIIIKDFSLNVKNGEKIAIVGPTGAGKTTLVNLLMKFYEINSGDILIDNVSIKDLTRENIHDLFTMVLQDTWLFNGTIRDNIKFNKKKVSDKKIGDICFKVGVDHFIKSLPNGLDYVIKETDSISAGQKQLLTIARGMITDTPFLILDEATSSVDTRTEELVQIAMDKLSKNKTSFIIAHRLSTIKNADKILVINEGNIIEQGNHKELMELNGFYKDLYESQFKKNNNFIEE